MKPNEKNDEETGAGSRNKRGSVITAQPFEPTSPVAAWPFLEAWGVPYLGVARGSMPNLWSFRRPFGNARKQRLPERRCGKIGDKAWHGGGRREGGPGQDPGGIGGDLLLRGRRGSRPGSGAMAPLECTGLVIRRSPVRLRSDQDLQPDKELVGDWILGKETRKGRWDLTGSPFRRR